MRVYLFSSKGLGGVADVGNGKVVGLVSGTARDVDGVAGSTDSTLGCGGGCGEGELGLSLAAKLSHNF